jgi:hypothetical protein
MKFDIWVFFEHLSRKFKFYYYWTRIMGNLHEDQYTIFIIFQSVLLRMRSVSEKNMLYFIFNIPPEYHAVYTIMWKNIAGQGRTGHR